MPDASPARPPVHSVPKFSPARRRHVVLHRLTLFEWLLFALLGVPILAWFNVGTNLSNLQDYGGAAH